MSGSMKGGAKLASRLKQMQEELGRSRKVEVGFFENATYPDGTPVAGVAATQEFGAVINMPEREQTIYRAIDKQGNLKHDGRFVKAARSNFASDHTVASHQIVIPARPFMRPTIEDKKGDWVRAGARELQRTGGNIDAALEAMGRAAAGNIQDKIAAITEPELATSTIRNKRARKSENPEKPLIDSGKMAQSVSYQVSDD